MSPRARWRAVAWVATVAVLAALLQSCSNDAADQPTGGATPRTASEFVRAVLQDHPTALLQGLTDLTGNGGRGTAVGGPTSTTLPNGDPATRFDGHGQYLEFASRTAFEIDATGNLTVEFWMRPDTLRFPRTEGSGYVYVIGKGDPGTQEWLARMYSNPNDEGRGNRISGYAFNPGGHLGAGSYFEDHLQSGQWIQVALVINTVDRSDRYPWGYTKLYKNGQLRDIDSLQSYDVVPRSGNAPLRIGTGYLQSFFEGAVGDVAFFDTELAGSQIAAHYDAMHR